MKLSVIIPWCNRQEIVHTLCENLRCHKLDQAELLVINGGGNQEQLRDLNQLKCHTGIRVITLNGVEEFNKSECLNVGAFFSSSGCLFVLDADIILTTDFLQQALQTIAQENCFVTVEQVIESRAENSASFAGEPSFIVERTVTTEYLCKTGQTASVRHRVDRNGTRTGPGLIVLKKEHFMAVEGLNSELRGWGYEDYDFQIRLQLGLGLRRVSFGQVLHWSHPPSRSGRDTNVRNAALCRSRYDRGEFLGTFSKDALRWQNKAVETVYPFG